MGACPHFPLEARALAHVWCVLSLDPTPPTPPRKKTCLRDCNNPVFLCSCIVQYFHNKLIYGTMMSIFLSRRKFLIELQSIARTIKRVGRPYKKATWKSRKSWTCWCRIIWLAMHMCIDCSEHNLGRINSDKFKSITIFHDQKEFSHLRNKK